MNRTCAHGQTTIPITACSKLPRWERVEFYVQPLIWEFSRLSGIGDSTRKRRENGRADQGNPLNRSWRYENESVLLKDKKSKKKPTNINKCKTQRKCNVHTRVALVYLNGNPLGWNAVKSEFLARTNLQRCTGVWFLHWNAPSGVDLTKLPNISHLRPLQLTRLLCRYFANLWTLKITVNQTLDRLMGAKWQNR
jgi:hypothetical protein